MKKLFIVVAVLVVLLICGLLFINSGVFVKSVVIPAASSSLGTEIEVEDVDFSIFKGIQLVNLVVEGTEGKPAPLTVDLIRLNYQFFSLLKGKVKVDEIVLENASLHIVEDKNGVLNLPAGPAAEPDSSTPKEPQKPKKQEESGTAVIPGFDIRNITVSNLSIEYERAGSEESPQASMKLSGVNFKLDTLAPGEAFKITSQCAASGMVDGQLNARADQCNLELNGTIREDFFPGRFNLSFNISEMAGEVGAVKLENRLVKFELACEGDGVNYQLEKCNISEQFQNKTEGIVALTGSFGLEPIGANLNLEMRNEGPGFLNLVGGLVGDYDFGNTNIKYTANLQLQNDGSTATFKGDMNVTEFSVSSQELGISGLPPLKVKFDHDLTFEQERQFVRLEKLNMVAADKSKEIMTLVLSEPTTISFNKDSQVEDTQATINLRVKDFNLEFLKPLIPESAGVELERGIVNETIDIAIYGGGERLELKGSSEISDLNLKAADQIFSNLGLQNQFKLKINNFFSEVVVEQLKINGRVNNKSAFEIDALAALDLNTKTGTASIETLAIHPEVGILIPENLMTGYELSNINCAGSFKLLLEEGEKAKINGGLRTEPIVIRNTRDNRTIKLSPKFDLDALYAMTGELQIRQFKLNLDQAGDQQDTVSLTGKLNTNSLEGDLELELSKLTASILQMSAAFVGLEFDFGNTSIESACKIKIANKGNNLGINGTLTIQELTFESEPLGIKPLRPLKIASSYSGDFFTENMAIDLDSFTFSVNDQASQIISASLKQPAVLNIVPPNSPSDQPPALFELNVDNLRLDLVEPLLAKEVNVDLRDGVMNSKVKINVSDLINQISCSGDLKFAGITVPDKNNADSESQSTLNTQVEFDLAYNSDGMAKVRKALLSVESNGEQLAQLKTVGEIDAAMMGKPSEISLKSLAPLQAKKLEDIAMALTGGEGQGPPPDETEKTEPIGSPTDDRIPKEEPVVGINSEQTTEPEGGQPQTPSLNIQLNVDIPELRYEQVVVTNLKPTIQVRNNVVTVNPFTFNINEGTAKCEAQYDYTNSNNSIYSSELELGNLNLQPIINSVLPEYANLVSGALSKAKISASGTSGGSQDFMENLKSKTSCELANFDFAYFMKDYNPLLSLVGIKASDFVFETLAIDGGLADNNIELVDFVAQNSNLRILSKGQLEFGGNWAPDLELALGFAGNLEKRVRKNKISVKKADDDFSYTDKLPLKVKSWAPKAMLTQWLLSPAVLDKLVSDPQKKAALLGAKGLKDVLSGQTSVKDVIKTGIDIFGSRKGKNSSTDSQESNDGQASEKTDDSKNTTKNLMDFFRK